MTTKTKEMSSTDAMTTEIDEDAREKLLQLEIDSTSNQAVFNKLIDLNTLEDYDESNPENGQPIRIQLERESQVIEFIDTTIPNEAVLSEDNELYKLCKQLGVVSVSDITRQQGEQVRLSDDSVWDSRTKQFRITNPPRYISSELFSLTTPLAVNGFFNTIIAALSLASMFFLLKDMTLFRGATPILLASYLLLCYIPVMLSLKNEMKLRDKITNIDKLIKQFEL